MLFPWTRSFQPCYLFLDDHASLRGWICFTYPLYICSFPTLFLYLHKRALSLTSLLPPINLFPSVLLTECLLGSPFFVCSWVHILQGLFISFYMALILCSLFVLPPPVLNRLVCVSRITTIEYAWIKLRIPLPLQRCGYYNGTSRHFYFSMVSIGSFWFNRLTKQRLIP